jgi:endonuclease III
MPDRKGDFIVGCFDRVQLMGGPEAAKAELLAQSGREAKIRWLKSMPGIGEKYARNIMMDVYHEDFRDCIAVDARIKSVSNSLGLSFASYKAHEAFYLGVARQASLNGWELDRLLYNFIGDVQSRL